MAKISKNELGPLARESIDALKSGGTVLRDRCAAIAEYSPSNQIEYIDAIRLKAMEQKFSSEPGNIYGLFHGLIQNIDLNTKTAHKLLKSVFDCVNVLGGEHSDSVCMDIYMDLAANYESRARNGKNPLLLDLRGLTEISGFIKGFEKSLVSDAHSERFQNSKSLWMNFLPELASRDTIPMSKESIRCMIRIVDSAPHEYPASIRLCRYPLSFAVDRPFVTAGKDSGGKSGEVSVNNQAKTSNIQFLPEVSMLLDGVSNLAAQLSKDLEKRLAAQAKIIFDKSMEYSDLKEQCKKLGDDLYMLEKRNSELRNKVDELKAEIDKVKNDLNKSTKDLESYSNRHDVILKGADQKEKDAELRTKRKFADSQRLVIASIQDCLSRLTALEAPETAAKQAAINFNNLLRYLTREGYILDGQISPVNIADGKRNGG